MQNSSGPSTDELLTGKHKRLLNIADWARYGAWFMLILSLITTVISLASNLRGLTQPSPEALWQGITDVPPVSVLDILAAFSGPARSLISAAAYFVLLRGVWLGLNMIVETDVNLRHGDNNGSDA